MSKHNTDLVMCRKQPGIAIGRTCEKCDGKCPRREAPLTSLTHLGQPHLRLVRAAGRARAHLRRMQLWHVRRALHRLWRAGHLGRVLLRGVRAVRKVARRVSQDRQHRYFPNGRILHTKGGGTVCQGVNGRARNLQLTNASGLYRRATRALRVLPRHADSLSTSVAIRGRGRPPLSSVRSPPPCPRTHIMASASGSLYALLSLAPSATADEIRSAYLRLAKAHHPDRAPPEQRAQATRDFQELARAYKTLSDPELRKAYDRTLGLASSAPAPISKPAPPLPRRPRSPSSSFAPSPAAYQHRPERPAPDSPFPGFRVPPGGYPADPLPISASAVPAVDLGGYVAAPRRRGERSWSARPPRAAYSPAPPPAAPACGFACPALMAEDPFALFQRVLDEQERFLRDAFSRSGVEGGGGLQREGRGVVRRREWNEGRREANGDAILFQGHEEVEQSADGGIRWKGESTTIAFTTDRPYDHRPDSYPPAFPSSSSYRRPPSPARIPPSPHQAQPPAHGYHPRSSSLSRYDGAAVPHLAHAHGAAPLRRPPSPAHHPLLTAPLAAPLAVTAPQPGYHALPAALPLLQQPHHQQRRLTHPSAPALLLSAAPLRAPSPAHRRFPLPAPAAPPLRRPKSPAGPPSPGYGGQALVPRASAQHQAVRTREPLTLEYGERPASPLFGLGDERDGAAVAVARRGAEGGGGGGARDGFERQWRKREREGVV